jgi:hypothetical protein
MEKKNSIFSLVLFLLILIAYSGFGISSPRNPKKPKDQETLDAILKKTGDRSGGYDASNKPFI